MPSAIGSSTYASTAGAGKPAASLETQLAQYQVKLADWVNCPSCKTPEGKAKIQQISDKISDIKQRLEVADATKQSGEQYKVAPASPAGIAAHAGNGNSPDSPRSIATGTLGSHVDVFA